MFGILQEYSSSSVATMVKSLVQRAKLQSSSKVLGRLPSLPLLFLPPPASGPMLIKNVNDVNVCACNCSVISQNWIRGDGGYLAKQKTLFFQDWNGLLLSCATFPTAFVCDCLKILGVAVKGQNSTTLDVDQNVNVCACTCSVISQHWRGGTGDL